MEFSALKSRFLYFWTRAKWGESENTKGGRGGGERRPLFRFILLSSQFQPIKQRRTPRKRLLRRLSPSETVARLLEWCQPRSQGLSVFLSQGERDSGNEVGVVRACMCEGEASLALYQGCSWKNCEFITSANVARAGNAIGQQNVRASICTATLLFSQPFFAFTEKWERMKFKHCTCVKILPTPQQTINFILTLIQCVLAFKYHVPLKLGLFYSAFSIDTWPYLFRVSPGFRPYPP